MKLGETVDVQKMTEDAARVFFAGEVDMHTYRMHIMVADGPGGWIFLAEDGRVVALFMSSYHLAPLIAHYKAHASGPYVVSIPRSEREFSA